MGILGSAKICYEVRKHPSFHGPRPAVLAKTPQNPGNDHISVFDLTSIRLESDTLFENYDIVPLYSKMQELKDVAE